MERSVCAIPKIQINQFYALNGVVTYVKIQEKMEVVNVEQMPLAQMTNLSARLSRMVKPNVRNAQKMHLVANLAMGTAQRKEIVNWEKFAMLLENVKVYKDVSFFVQMFCFVVYEDKDLVYVNHFFSMLAHSSDCFPK